jgi:hypothetical protein
MYFYVIKLHVAKVVVFVLLNCGHMKTLNTSCNSLWTVYRNILSVFPASFKNQQQAVSVTREAGLYIRSVFTEIKSILVSVQNGIASFYSPITNFGVKRNLQTQGSHNECDLGTSFKEGVTT